ncbi:MAG TPA: DUF2924 domain-containing protein [Rickettsiales bacterium]|nr:DUF2924 domain-containing protein [Rickettsiales bacterium]
MYLKQETINNNTGSNNNSIKANRSTNKQIDNSANELNSDNSFQVQFVNTQILNLQKLSLIELKEKYKELFKTNNLDIKDIKFKKGYLIKVLSYKIQVLYGMSNTSEEEIEELIKITKQRLNQTERITIDNSRKKIVGNETKYTDKIPNTQDLNPPITIGSTITTYRGNQEYIVKVLPDNKFSYNQKIYNSLTAIATDITGTKWNGYNFFKLKRRTSNNFLSINDNNDNNNNKQMVAV